jgi:hypothetical protein
MRSPCQISGWLLKSKYPILVEWTLWAPGWGEPPKNIILSLCIRLVKLNFVSVVDVIGPGFYWVPLSQACPSVWKQSVSQWNAASGFRSQWHCLLLKIPTKYTRLTKKNYLIDSSRLSHSNRWRVNEQSDVSKPDASTGRVSLWSSSQAWGWHISPAHQPGKLRFKFQLAGKNRTGEIRPCRNVT